MTEVLLVMGFPLIGALLQALWGHRRFAAGLNASTSLLTFLASAALTARVVSLGPLTVMHELFFVDAFNVFLVALTAFVGFTTAIFSRVYMRVEQDRGKLSAGASNEDKIYCSQRKSNLGMNAILSVSLALGRLIAARDGVELSDILRKLEGTIDRNRLYSVAGK